MMLTLIIHSTFRLFLNSVFIYFLLFKNSSILLFKFKFKGKCQRLKYNLLNNLNIMF